MQLENEVHQVMAVMEADTGKLLNYRQLISSTKFRKAWSLLLANEFGKLAIGIGGQKKPPTLSNSSTNTRYLQTR
jgi:hypothetical protein